MKQVKRVLVATAMLVGLFAATRGQEATASGKGDDGGGGEEAAACQLGYVGCPDVSGGFTLTYTTRACFSQCVFADYGNASSAMLACNDICDAACVNYGFSEQCGN